ncbi:hypothetical protein HNQ34_002720 [Anoxybacillus tepidamans]|uniref:Uncharacterized protein n=1 Tax=Anoxybacteroides tepidamans TaxID=265948 RepID=A0A7W8MVS1_9BACL|nr:hypothetical protein [Anoxybacillus tepidamans]
MKTSCATIPHIGQSNGFFRQAKDQLKLDGYRVRGRRAVKRYWVLVQLAYVYSMFESNSDFKV